MKARDFAQIAIFALGVYLYRKECGQFACAIARTLNSRPIDILGRALMAL